MFSKSLLLASFAFAVVIADTALPLPSSFEGVPTIVLPLAQLGAGPLGTLGINLGVLGDLPLGNGGTPIEQVAGELPLLSLVPIAATPSATKVAGSLRATTRFATHRAVQTPVH